MKLFEKGILLLGIGLFFLLSAREARAEAHSSCLSNDPRMLAGQTYCKSLAAGNGPYSARWESTKEPVPHQSAVPPLSTDSTLSITIYSSTGPTARTFRIHLSQLGRYKVTGLTVDSKGNVYLAGFRTGLGTSLKIDDTVIVPSEGSTYVTFVTKMSRDGEVLWTKLFDHVTDAAPLLVLDSNEDIIYADTHFKLSSSSGPSDWFAGVIKFSPNSDVLWTNRASINNVTVFDRLSSRGDFTTLYLRFAGKVSFENKTLDCPQGHNLCHAKAVFAKKGRLQSLTFD